MRNLEYFVNNHPQLIEFADFLLPEIIKSIIRKIILNEQYPLHDPIEIEISGFKAKFWIENPSDWYRIALGGFEEGFAQELISSLHINDVFLDIGSAQGIYAIIASVAGVETYAIDPDPVSLNSIRKNRTLNEISEEKLHILETAIGDQVGSVEFKFDPKGVQAASIKRVNRELSQSVNVPLTTVDTLISNRQIKIPTVVKIDVEGAESMVLKGMNKLLTSKKPPTHLFIELHEQFLPKFGSSVWEILNTVASVGYIAADNSFNHRGKQLQHFIHKDLISESSENFHK